MNENSTNFQILYLLFLIFLGNTNLETLVYHFILIMFMLETIWGLILFITPTVFFHFISTVAFILGKNGMEGLF